MNYKQSVSLRGPYATVNGAVQAAHFFRTGWKIRPNHCNIQFKGAEAVLGSGLFYLEKAYSNLDSI